MTPPDDADAPREPAALLPVPARDLTAHELRQPLEKAIA